MLHTGCPNKFFDALAAGNLVFSNLGSWTADVIEQKQIGFAHDPLNPEQFAERVQHFFELENVRNAQARSSRLQRLLYDNEISIKVRLRTITPPRQEGL